MGCVLVIVLSVIVGCDGGEEEEGISTRRCEQVRDRLVDLRLADAAGVDRAAHRAAMTAALGTDFVTSCTHTLSSAQIRCVLDARDRGAADACASSR
jgi:hypothetical protein